MTKKEIAAKLREALALMNDTGRHWIRGEYKEGIEFDEDGEVVEYGYCSLGAIRTVTDTPVYDGSSRADEVSFALAAVLPPKEPGEYTQTPEALAYDQIVSWNDDDERSWEEVVAKFNEAVARAESEE